jgi:outer membrane biosynthesis protein TonB
MSNSSKLNPSWPLWAVGISAGILGAMISSTFLMLHHVEFARASQAETATLKGKVSLLEIALNQAQPYVVKLDEQPAAQPVVEPVTPAQIQPSTVAAVKAPAAPTPPAPAAAHQQRPAVTPQAPAPTVKPPATPAPVVAAKPAPVAAPAQPQPAPVQASTAQPVTSEELAAAAKNKIEGVSSATAGIARLTPDSVEFLSGRRVRTGELFPSGEKLLKVDPASGRIVTNQRQLLIFEQ